MATTLPPVSAQVVLLPTGVLQFTLVRTAPTGGTLTSTAGYNIRLSGTGVTPYTFILTPAIAPADVNITRSVALADLGQTFTVDTPGLAINIQAISGDAANFSTGPWWPADRPFPSSYSLVTSNPIPNMGDTVTLSLPSGYGTDNLTRIRFSQNISDPSLFSPWKSFFPGIAFDCIYRVAGTYTASAEISADTQNALYGSSFLIRSVLITETVATVAFSQTGVNSWLGQSGFAFTDPQSSNYSPGNFSVILTGAAVASSNRELKMFLASSRSADANTYYQTTAWDLFPVPGRYKIPSFTPAVNFSFDMTRAYTDASLYAPLKLTSMPLPEFQVGYFYELELACSGGLKPYAFYAVDLPPGLTLTSQGRITGTPQQSGLYQASVSVVDSENPPQIDVRTMNIYVQTDLSLDPIPYQSYAVGQLVSQPVTAVGGVPPYSWQVSTGTTDLTNYGISFIPGVSSASFSGTVVDQGAARLPYIFPVTVQCIDAIGSTASVTFNCGITSSKLTILTTYLDEIFDGEYHEQRILAMGGDNTSYTWSLEYLSGPADAQGNLILPPAQLITLTPTGLTGAGNTAILSYNPSAVDRSVNGGSPENFYRVRITVTSGSASFAESATYDYDLIISPALTDVVIENDCQLPMAYPSDLTWSVTLLPVILDSLTVPANRLGDAKGSIYFSTDSSWVSSGAQTYLNLSQSGVLTLNPKLTTLPDNLNLWFRVILTAGRTTYFKDFHFMSATNAAFSIHVDNSFPLPDSSNLVGIAQQYASGNIMRGDGCISFKVLNASISRWVNDVGTFTVEDLSLLPPGMSFSSLGFLYGTPTESGTFKFNVIATVGTSTASYLATVVVNPSSAYASDLVHDVVVSPNTPPVTAITYPPVGRIYPYGSVISLAQLVQDADLPYTDPSDSVLSPNFAGEEAYTYQWNFGALPTETDSNGLTYQNIVTATNADQVTSETGTVLPVTIAPGTAINQDTTSAAPQLVLLTKSRVGTTFTLQVTVTDSMGDTGSAQETIVVGTPWFRTASLKYDTNGTQDLDESLTDGTLSIDLLGDWNPALGTWNS